MKVLFSSLAVVTIMSFFSSCQREVDWNIFQSDNADTTWLTRVVSLDTTKMSGLDTTVIANYRYDANKRLSNYDFIEFDLNNVRYADDYKFHYRNNTDSLPYMLSASYQYVTDKDTTYFFYQNGFIVKDSSINFSAGIPLWLWESTYSTVGSNRYLRKKYSTNLSGGTRNPFDSTIYYRTVSNGNIISALDSLWGDSGFFLNRNSEQMSFDSQKSFSHRFNNWYLGYSENIMDELWPSNGINNLLSYNFTNTFSAGSYTITYEYNTAGFPTVARLAGNPDVNKTIFFYSRLP